MIYFDQNIWKQKFISNEYNTAWKCGKCNVGSLQLTKKIKEYSYAEFQTLRCKNPGCGMGYQVLGLVKPTADGMEVSPTYFRIDDYQIHPTQFQPELVMFSLPSTMRDDIKKLIVKSFNHFWYDLDACANKIRQALELIVDERGAIGLTLDQKIKSLEGTLNQDLFKNILALKWIGNDGSHASRPFQRSEILDTYSFLVDVLNQLYPDESEKEMRDNLAQLIIDKRGLKKV
jgi:hypothetical protein